MVSVGPGLQVLDLRRLKLSGRTVLELPGTPITELMVRLDRQLRLGPPARVVLDGMTPDQVLWVARGRIGGAPTVGRAAALRGTVLATERRGGIKIGASGYVEGALFGQSLLVKGPETTIVHYPWRGKLRGVD